MTIPLDNLYHYIDGLFPEPVCMYLFYPHGSRNILNLIGIKSFDRLSYNLDNMLLPQIVCNDQESLDYEFYENLANDVLINLRKKNKRSSCTTNIKVALPINIYDNILLIHSEKNSPDLEKYKSKGYVDIYYWCHAIIARDWYRFAEHDPRLILNTVSPTKDFLIYCRDWSGSREYRIKFQELLSNYNLVKNSITGIKKINGDGNDIKNHTFKNINFVPSNLDFFESLLDNTVSACSSADYCPKDFNNSHISVVLETVFDGSKIHLTEKILRPISCGHPFMLAAGPRSLEYLRSYGFKTFDPWIDESYDQENDSVKRLQKIVDSMNNFAALSATNKNYVIGQLKKIADYNKKWFFSEDFINKINQELITNINTGYSKIKKSRAIDYRLRKKDRSTRHAAYTIAMRNIIANYLSNLKKLNPPGQ
jgi:hypothetical protein